MAHSTANAAQAKPAKPYPDFPLFPHATRRWAKKIKGKLYYFGPWSDPQAALEKYTAERDDLYAGRKPRVSAGVNELTVKRLVDTFLTVKEDLVEAGEITRRHWCDYERTAKRMADLFGRHRAVADLRPEDFEQYRSKFAKTLSAAALGREVQLVRSILKYGYDADLLAAPVKVGPTFKRPPKKARRKERKAAGPKLFTAEEINAMLAKASPPMRAMILLGLNAAMGNHDVATLPIDRLDLNGGWHNYERVKTQVDRHCPLWPETVAAIKAVLAVRKEPKNDADKGLLFVTKFGERWVRLSKATSRAKDKESWSWIDSVGLEFGKLQKAVGCVRPGVKFYSLRRTFRTVADETKDQPAVMAIMGHADADSDMGAVYRQEIGDDRLQAVVDHVHSWLFAKGDASHE